MTPFPGRLPSRTTEPGSQRGPNATPAGSPAIGVASSARSPPTRSKRCPRGTRPAPIRRCRTHHHGTRTGPGLHRRRGGARASIRMADQEPNERGRICSGLQSSSVLLAIIRDSCSDYLRMTRTECSRSLRKCSHCVRRACNHRLVLTLDANGAIDQAGHGIRGQSGKRWSAKRPFLTQGRSPETAESTSYSSVKSVWKS